MNNDINIIGFEDLTGNKNKNQENCKIQFLWFFFDFAQRKIYFFIKKVSFNNPINYTSMVTGFSIKPFNVCKNIAPVAPSTVL